ncbi:hypothetical protein RFW18_15905 [Metabacillus idriensis]|uniref:hypothetical protein n=1 Tax=Metabacillus idriensis TaxID=324768 RepID=UPI002812E5FD|nr:hypothetical protein [Metabacillus idriensis]MDR0139238.1 hypothetical protein [Metabacillus idriensis]
MVLKDNGLAGLGDAWKKESIIAIPASKGQIRASKSVEKESIRPEMESIQKRVPPFL